LLKFMFSCDGSWSQPCFVQVASMEGWRWRCESELLEMEREIPDVFNIFALGEYLLLDPRFKKLRLEMEREGDLQLLFVITHCRTLALRNRCLKGRRRFQVFFLVLV
jgi:hypothetical protein